MLIGKVVGTLVATRKDEKLEGLKFLVLKQVDVEGREGGGYVVAVDAVGAGLGEYVLYASGSSARQTVVTDKRPCDAVIMAIIDQWEVGGELKYRKVTGEYQS
ncbi:MAG: EutN/CcmL family microcompartment protein [Anaerolineae bacterium]